ncbi:uncharacterized protein LOC141641047 [Silene latifolia]|uniref:uncharacterized protein LOC141641047 n=1 Tax=Silene latifolia TaxID=37657 RepID=UPI003D76A99E
MDRFGFWNIRGLNSLNKQKEIKWFLHSNNIGLFGLVETRVKSNNWLKVRNNLCSSWALCTNNSLHKNGRVWLLWDPNCFDVNVVDITSQTIHSFVLSKMTGRKFWFTVVYGFNHSTGRELLWNKLKEYAASCQEAWAVGGDFNNVLNYNERIGSDITSAEIAPFQDCVHWCQLQDIPAIGSFFTWNNKQGVESRVYSRIDRMLVNDEWISKFPESYLKGFMTIVLVLFSLIPWLVELELLSNITTCGL